MPMREPFVKKAPSSKGRGIAGESDPRNPDRQTPLPEAFERPRTLQGSAPLWSVARGRSTPESEWYPLNRTREMSERAVTRNEQSSPAVIPTRSSENKSSSEKSRDDPILKGDIGPEKNRHRTRDREKPNPRKALAKVTDQKISRQPSPASHFEATAARQTPVDFHRATSVPAERTPLTPRCTLPRSTNDKGTSVETKGYRSPFPPSLSPQGSNAGQVISLRAISYRREKAPGATCRDNTVSGK